jgi:hypothetical protein
MNLLRKRIGATLLRMQPCFTFTGPSHPPVGLFIAILAFVGVLGPLFRAWEKITLGERAFWTVIMFGLLGMEFRTLYLDRTEHDKDQEFARCEQLKKFGEVAKTIADSNATNQKHFDTTMRVFTAQQSRETSSLVTLWISSRAPVVPRACTSRIC